MLDEKDEAYQKAYNEALAKLDGTAVEATTPPEPEPKPEAAPVKAVADEAKPEEPQDPLKELQERLAKTEKALNDTKAWGTKNAQRIAEIDRERVEQQREASRPAILEANPDLADAIRYVTNDPTPQHQEDRLTQNWQEIVLSAHPGIFDLSIDPELEKAVMARRDAIGDAWNDPLIAIREITAEKMAFTERQVSKRFEIEAAKQAQKSAMSVPGSGSSAVPSARDPAAEEAQRILKMSDADFAKEVRRVKGY